VKLALLTLLVAAAVAYLAFQNASLFFLGYLWASVIYPSAFTGDYLTYVPLTFLFGIGSVISYLTIDKSNRTSFPLSFYLTILFAIWITITTIGAVYSDDAWLKWRWAFPSVLIAVAAPIFLRTRAQIEAGYIAILSALSAHVLTAGIKSMLGTGGYDRLGTLMGSNVWLGETSTLALAAVISIPMAWYAVRHSVILLPYRGKRLNIVALIYTYVAVMCVVGTSARTGVLALGTLLLSGFRRFSLKLLAGLLAVGLFFLAREILPERSMARFQTIQTYDSDTSAESRLGVWKWATDYVTEHPMGGGFGIFRSSLFRQAVKDSRGQVTFFTDRGRAAHSVYFEVLGEQGYPGIMLFVLFVSLAAAGCYRITRRASSNPEDEWFGLLGRSLLVCILVFAVGGTFIGVGYQPLIYCLTGLYHALHRLVYQKKSRPSVSGALVWQ